MLILYMSENIRFFLSSATLSGKTMSDKSDKNFVQESVHLQAVLLDKRDEICQGDENFVRRK